MGNPAAPKPQPANPDAFEHAVPREVFSRDILPIPDPKQNSARERLVLEGDVPSPIDPPPGCRFHTRCPLCTYVCTSDEPALIEHRPEHFAACHHPQNV